MLIDHTWKSHTMTASLQIQCNDIIAILKSYRLEIMLHMTSQTWSKLMLSEDIFNLAAQHYSLSQELTVWLLDLMLLKFGIDCQCTSRTVSLKHLRCSWKVISFRKRISNFLCLLLPLNISLMILVLYKWHWLIDWLNTKQILYLNEDIVYMLETDEYY